MNFTCECGKVSGVIHETKELRHHRFICLCKDCQTYARFLGHPEKILDANGGTEAIPVFPKLFEITTGREHIRGLKLTEKTGTFRWYTNCCRSPLANSLSSKAGYVGLIAARLDTSNRDALGPIRLRANGKSGIPPLPAGTHKGFPLPWIFVTVKLILRMYLKGWKRPNPFFSAEDVPLAAVHILNQAEFGSKTSYPL
jgi:hypothetical protein